MSVSNYFDRVKETSATTGTGAMSLAGNVTGYRAFSGVFTTGQTTHYTIENPSTGEWEVGLGTLTSGSPWTLTRTTVLASSNANAAVSFAAGTKYVYCDVPASVALLIQTAVQNGRQIINGDGITGGGDFSADRTLKINAAPSTIASATTTDLSSVATLRVTISGTVTITSLGTGVNLIRFVKFSGALILTHNATSLILPGAANITTAAGDTATFISDGSGNWTCERYQRNSTGSLAALKAGTAANNVVQLDGSGNLPALNAAALTALTATNISSGLVPTARLGSGTANSSTFLRGDQTFATPSGGSWSLLATLTTTSGSTQSATGLGTNSAYLIVLKNVSTSASAKTLSVALSTNNGGAYNTAIQIALALASAGNGWYGYLIIPGASDSNAKRISGVYVEGSNGLNVNATIGVAQEDVNSTGAVNAMQFSTNGTFDAGSIYIYGM